MKKTVQVSFKTEEPFAHKLEAWAEEEEIPVADFVRKLVRFAATAYEKAGSLHALRTKEKR